MIDAALSALARAARFPAEEDDTPLRRRGVTDNLRDSPAPRPALSNARARLFAISLELRY
jgi:hypothetical protein